MRGRLGATRLPQVSQDPRDSAPATTPVGRGRPPPDRSRIRLARATFIELRKSASSAAGRWLLIVTALLGVSSAALVASADSGQAPTFALVSFYVQSVISLPLPFVSILMTRDLQRPLAYSAMRPALSFGSLVSAKLLASAVIAVLGATYGAVISALGTTFSATAADDGRWVGVGTVLVGSFVVQLIAELCGSGFGLLIIPTAAAIVADVVIPLGLWVLTGAIPALHGAQAWVTPFASVGHLLSGHMDGQRWAQVGVVVLIWVVALNAAGLLRRMRLS
jgi:hypothetical protein